MKRFVLVLSLTVVFSTVGCGSSKQRPNGGAIIPAQEETASVSNPIIEVVETEIDLGDISSDVQEIVGNIFFFNAGNKPLQVRKVYGPCSCFIGSSGDKMLAPGEGGQLEVKFDKNKIPAGPVKRIVNIETNDPINKIVKVNFSFNIDRPKDEEELRILQSNLTLMQKDIRLLRSDMGKVLNELQSIKASGGNTVASPSGHKKIPKAVDTTVYDVAIGDSPTLGSKNAPVTITEFIDFQCPYCVREHPKIKEVLEAYEGKVQIVFKHYPLSFHKKAKPVHAVAELALQEKGNDAFWEMHDMILAEPKNLEISDLRGYAEKIGLDLENFDKIMADEEAIDKLLETDMVLAGKYNVRGTPTIFINGLKLQDRTLEGYRKRINDILGIAKAS